MCLAACKWANIEHIYYGCTIADNSDIGFRDTQIDKELGERPDETDYMNEEDRDACLQLFEEYRKMNAVIY